jgi:hypothetical protein
LEQAGREDLIGSGCDCLIPDQPPREALEARRRAANHDLQRGKQRGRGRNGDDRDMDDADLNDADASDIDWTDTPTKTHPAAKGAADQPRGYRPGRKTHSRRRRNR